MSFALGAIDGPTGANIAEHIYTKDAGDYYAPDGPPPAAGQPSPRLRASCHCGGVAFTLPRPEGGVGACHCTQCRKLSGHYSPRSIPTRRGDLRDPRDARRVHRAGRITARLLQPLRVEPVFPRRGWRFLGRGGGGGRSDGLRLDSHIFVADKGDYYRLEDGLPQFRGWTDPCRPPWNLLSLAAKAKGGGG